MTVECWLLVQMWCVLFAETVSALRKRLNVGERERLDGMAKNSDEVGWPTDAQVKLIVSFLILEQPLFPGEV